MYGLPKNVRVVPVILVVFVFCMSEVIYSFKR